MQTTIPIQSTSLIGQGVGNKWMPTEASNKSWALGTAGASTLQQPGMPFASSTVQQQTVMSAVGGSMLGHGEQQLRSSTVPALDPMMSGSPQRRMFSVGPTDVQFQSSLSNSVFARFRPDMRRETHSVFGQKIDELTWKTPLVIHTLVLPEGMTPEDPRLAEGRVVSEKSYVSDSIVLPQEAFTAHMDVTLLSPGETEDKFVDN